MTGLFVGAEGVKVGYGYLGGVSPVDIAFDVGEDLAMFFGFAHGFKSGLKAGLANRQFYEVTYTRGRAKGVIHTPESTKVFDVTATEKQILPEPPKQELYKTLRIRVARSPTKGGFVTVGTQYNAPASVYVPQESVIVAQEVMTTELGKPVYWTLTTARKPNIGEGVPLRFALADYGEVKAAEYTVKSLGPQFNAQDVVKITAGEWAPVVGKIDIAVPVSYSTEEFSTSPVSRMLGEVFAKPFLSQGTTLSDAEYMHLIQNALKSIGAKTITSVKPVPAPAPLKE